MEKLTYQKNKTDMKDAWIDPCKKCRREHLQNENVIVTNMGQLNEFICKIA